MEKHLLVTVSDQKSAMYGVRFVGTFFASKEAIKLTLFYTTPKPPAVWEGERTSSSYSQREQMIREYEKKGRVAMETAKQELLKLSFKDTQIEMKLRPRMISKADDIIQEGSRGLYDAIVLGRRGLSWIQEAIDGSVSKDILEKKFNFPFWLCRRPEPDRKNMLVCVDGSDAAYRMVDHVGFILGQEKKHETTLLTVKKKGSTSGETIENIFAKSKEHLLNNEFPENMIETKVIDDGSVAKGIIREANQRKYAAVAIGRTGTGQGFLKKLSMGSVSDTLFREMEGAALWVCQ
jgi:nucleotide-binding universal stress UspA family protein